MRGKITSTLLILLSLILIAGCMGRSNEPIPSEAMTSVTFTDALDREVIIASPIRVGILSGSLAQAWKLAGGSITAATEDAFELANLSLAKDVISLGSVKSPDIESIITSELDFVLLSSAISGQVSLSPILEKAGIAYAFFDIETFSDYKEMMDIFAKITGRIDLHVEYVDDVETRIQEQIARADGSRPTILFLRAYSTGIAAKDSSSMTGQMLQDLGCTNIADGDSLYTENLSLEAILAADPEYIFITTMGDSEEALAYVDEHFTASPAWSTLTAVKENRYFLLPQDLFHLKPNERWDESYRFLADILYGGENAK